MGKLHQTNPGQYRPLLHLVEPSYCGPPTDMYGTSRETHRPVQTKLATETTGKLRTYKLIKKEFKNESYLELPQHMRVSVARLRTNTHPLRIEIGRYNLPTPIPAEERYCWFCQNSLVEDECHFLFDCSLYDTMQEKSALLNYCSLLNPAFPNVDKWRFISESAATDTHLTYIFSKYVSCALNIAEVLFHHYK